MCCRAWVTYENCLLITEKDCTSSIKSKGSSKAKYDAAIKEMRDHISKLEARFAFKYPYAQPKTQIDGRKIHLKVSEDEAEDLLSEPEPEPEPVPEPEPLPVIAAADHAPADSPDETPLQIDESAATSKTSEKSEVSVPAAPQNDSSVSGTVCTVTESVKKSNVPKPQGTPRSKIAQSLKKTLETRRSMSLSIPDAEPAVAVCDADAAQIAKLNTEVVSLKRELETNRRNHMKELEAQKRRTDTAIAGLQREKEQALQRVTEELKKEHAEQLRIVKNKQWCAQCSNIAQYYCCWNTSYCSIECQNFHWQHHMSTCQQQQQRPQSESRA